MTDSEIKTWTLIAAGVSALISIFSIFMQRASQKAIEKLKDNLSTVAFVHQKQIEVRQELLAVLDDWHGADAMLEASIVRVPHEYDMEAELVSVKIEGIVYRLNDWYRKNDLFIPSKGGIEQQLRSLLDQVKTVSFEMQTMGQPMSWDRAEALRKDLDGLIEAVIREVNRPLKKLFAPIVEGAT